MTGEAGVGGGGKACTSLCVVVGWATSGQQLGPQALYLGVFGGQDLLQLGDFCLWKKAEGICEAASGTRRATFASQRDRCRDERMMGHSELVASDVNNSDSNSTSPGMSSD